jgi:beta-lactamase regulating signal transducer with metallopeptidase domain
VTEAALSQFFFIHLWGCTWQIALLFAVVWTVSRFTPRAPARWHYLLWMLVLIKVFLPPALYSPTSLRSIIEWRPPGESTVHTSTWSQFSTLSSRDENPPQKAEPGRFEGKGSTENFPIAETLVLVWSLGCILSFTRYGSHAVAIQRRLRSSRTFNGEVTQQVRGLANSRIRLVEGAGGPFVVGVFSPKILVPKEFFETTTGEAFELAILHETEHIRRRDGLWNLAILIAKAVFWFHPLVHYSMQKFRDAREMLIDETVLASRGARDRRLYNDLILSLLATRVSSTGTVSGMSACSLHGLKERVRRVGEFAPERTRVGVLRWVVLSLVIAITVPVGAGPDNTVQQGALLSGSPGQVDSSTPNVEVGFSFLEIEYSGENLKEIDRILKRGDSVQGGEILIDDPEPFTFDLRRDSLNDFEDDLRNLADVRQLTAPKITLLRGVEGLIQIAPGQLGGDLGLEARALAEIESASRIRLNVQSILYDATKTDRLTIFDKDGNPIQSDPMKSGNRVNVSMSVENGGAVVVGGLRPKQMGNSEQPTTVDNLRIREWVMVIPVKSEDAPRGGAPIERQGLGPPIRKAIEAESSGEPVEGNTRTVEIQGNDPASIHSGLALSATDPNNPVFSVVVQLLSLSHSPQSDRDFWARIEKTIGRPPIQIESEAEGASGSSPSFSGTMDFPNGRGWFLAASEMRAVSEELQKLGQITVDAMPILLLPPDTSGVIQMGKEIPFVSKIADTAFLSDGSQRSEVTVEQVEVGEVIHVEVATEATGLIDLVYRHQSNQIRGTTSLTDSLGNPLQGKPVLDERNLFFRTQIEDGGGILIGGYRRTMNEQSSFLGLSSKPEVVDSFVLASVKAHP